MRQLRGGGGGASAAAAAAAELSAQLTRLHATAASARDSVRGSVDNLRRYGAQGLVDSVTRGSRAGGHTDSGGGGARSVKGAAPPALPVKLAP